MHSFHHSRGRIFFEVLCALVVAASCGGAWKQTGAWAFLPAGAAALLYALVHTFDMLRRSSTGTEEPQRIGFAADGQADLPTVEHVGQPPAPIVVQAVVPETVEEPAQVEPVGVPVSAEPLGEESATKTPKARKSAKAPKNPKATEPVKARNVAEPALAQEPEPVGAVSEQVIEFPLPVEDHHPHIAPLFEPDPFGRMPRRAFGRKSG